MSFKYSRRPYFKNPFFSGDWLTAAFKSKVLSDIANNRVGMILCAIAAHLPTPYPSDRELAALVGIGQNSKNGGRTTMRAPLAFLDAAGFLRVKERFGRGNKVYQLVDARRFIDNRDPLGDRVAGRVADLRWLFEREENKTSVFHHASVELGRRYMAENPLPPDHWLTIDQMRCSSESNEEFDRDEP